MDQIFRNSEKKSFFIPFFFLSSLHCVECTLFAVVLDINLIIQVLNFIAC